MPGQREPISLDFGIQDSLDADSPEMLEDLFESDLPQEEPIKGVDPKKKTKQKTPEVKEISDDELFEALSDEPSEQEEEEVEEPVKPATSKKTEDDNEADEDAAQEEEESSEEQPEDPTEMIKTLSNDLFKLGIFELDEDEEEPQIDSVEAFKERFLIEKKRDAGKMLENFVSSKGKDYEEAFKAIFIDGLDPRSYYSAASQAQALKDLDLEKEENQKYVIRKSLQQQGWDESDIDEEVERLETYADLKSGAQRHHKVLVKQEEARLAREQEAAAERQQQEKERRQAFQQNLANTLKEKLQASDFDGIPVSKEFANDTYNFITDDKYVTADGKRLTEWDKLYLDLKRPENHQKLVKLAMLAQLVEKDPTLSTIKRKVNTDKVNKEFSVLAKKGQLTKKAPATPPAKRPFI